MTTRRILIAPVLWLLLVTAVAISGCAFSADLSTPQGIPRADGTTVTPPGSSAATEVIVGSATATGPPLVFAIIGDFGTGDDNEQAVADLVRSWEPAFIVTTGDNYYRAAGGKGSQRYDRSVRDYYAPWLRSGYPAFFPALGNHDYSDARPGPVTYLDYFDLPGEGLTSTSGNERYYDFIRAPVRIFILNSNKKEPDGTGSTARQALWLKKQLSASTSPWNLVVSHHPPFSSDARHGSSEYMRWPYARWGADAVFSGHAHTYERTEHDGIPYFVNGLGGAKRYAFANPVKRSRFRYNDDWGAQRITVTNETLVLEFFSVDGVLRDTLELQAGKHPE